MHTIYSYKDLYEGMKEDRIELQIRINKAIEQINWLIEYVEYEEDTTFYTKYFDEIIYILKGSDKE